MSSAGEIQAALAWADRMERGEVATYDPYIVALAKVVREQQTRIEKYERAVGSLPGLVPDWEAIIIKLDEEAQRIAALEAALRPFAENWDLHAAKHLSLDDARFRLLEDDVAKAMIEAIAQARIVLEPPS